MATTATFYIPKSKHSELIGKQGQRLKDLQSNHDGHDGVKILVPGKDDDSNEVVVSGPPAAVEKVRAEIEKLLNIDTKHPHVTWSLDIPPDKRGKLIGKGGDTLHNLQREFEVSINIPRQDGAAEQFVTISGQEAQLEALVKKIKAMDITVEVKHANKKAEAPSIPHLPSGPINRVLFFPDKDAKMPNIHEFLNFLGSATKTLEICVYTITDDRISNAIIKTHARGVKVRIITDNDQSVQLGSDIESFKKAGIAVKMDVSPFFMHHKFAVVDNTLLLNGSFNWTKGASTNNCENIMITNNPEFVKAFDNHFESMWSDNVNFK